MISAGMGFAVSATRFIAQLASVKDDTGTIIGQLKIITGDVVEAVNLLHRNRSYLSEVEKQGTDRVIEETKRAINRIAKHVEPARRHVAKRGTVNIVDRFDWVIRRSSAAESYQHSLNACQQSLQGKIAMLRLAALNNQVQMPPPYNEASRGDGYAYLPNESRPKSPFDEEPDAVSDGDGMSNMVKV